MEKTESNIISLKVKLLDNTEKQYYVKEDNLVDSLLTKIGEEINIPGDQLRIGSNNKDFYKWKHLRHDFKGYNIKNGDSLFIYERIWDGHVTYVDFYNQDIPKIKIETCTNDKVSYLMKLINDEVKINKDFSIVFAGKTLTPERSLADYCVQTMSTVHCVIKIIKNDSK